MFIRLSEGAVDKIVIRVRIPVELKYKVLRGFGTEGGPLSEALLADLEVACKDVKLLKCDLEAIQRTIDNNMAYRMEQRRKRDAGELQFQKSV